jgi:hypothetical protein
MNGPEGVMEDEDKGEAGVGAKRRTEETGAETLGPSTVAAKGPEVMTGREGRPSEGEPTPRTGIGAPPSSTKGNRLQDGRASGNQKAVPATGGGTEGPERRTDVRGADLETDQSPETGPTDDQEGAQTGTPECPVNPEGNSKSLKELMIQSQSLMMQNMSMMASSTMDHQQKEDNRKSMMSKIIREDEHLFTLLAAESRDEDHPRMCTFTRDLMADKDVHLAWAEIKRRIMEWPGLVSQKQMTKFLGSGFIAPDLDEAPGGFTLFMFRPTDFPPARSSKEEFNAMRALLGETKLDNELIRFYAENEFFIAQSVGQLEDQLTMAALTLQLFTRDYSIGLEGYKYLLKNIRRHRGKFERMFKVDPLSGAKVGYWIDTIFQTFCLELTKLADKKYPIKEARRNLKGYMEDEIADLVKAVRRGRVPSMILPPTLSYDDDNGRVPRKGKDRANPKEGTCAGKLDPKKHPPWFAMNPEPI